MLLLILKRNNIILFLDAQFTSDDISLSKFRSVFNEIIMMAI